MKTENYFEQATIEGFKTLAELTGNEVGENFGVHCEDCVEKLKDFHESCLLVGIRALYLHNACPSLSQLEGIVFETMQAIGHEMRDAGKVPAVMVEDVAEYLGESVEVVKLLTDSLMPKLGAVLCDSQEAAAVLRQRMEEEQAG